MSKTSNIAKITSWLPIGAALLAVLLLVAVTIWPQIDLIVSGWFYAFGKGFVFADQPVFVFLHWLAYYGTRALIVILLFGIAFSIVRLICGISLKGFIFLLLGLLIAPGLIANIAFKDHWGRARPREVTQFGGKDTFSPALVPQDVTHGNGSFVSGDGAFGFYLPSFGYVVPRRRSRRVFWSGIGAGGLFALARIAMGAHFLSDTLFAALFMLAATAGLHAIMYGPKATRSYWRDWFFRNER